MTITPQAVRLTADFVCEKPRNWFSTNMEFFSSPLLSFMRFCFRSQSRSAELNTKQRQNSAK